MALPPTATKFSTDVSNVTTFFFDFPNFTGSHSGVTASLGINSVAGGGTGLASLTLNNVILGNGTSSPTFVAPGTAGNVLTSDGTTWISSPPSSTTTDSFSVYLNTTTSFAANAPIIYDTEFFDNASAYNTSTGIFTTPVTGDYQFNVGINASGGNTAHYLWKNSAQFISIIQATAGGQVSGVVILSLIAGDTIYVSPDTTRSFTGVGGGVVFNTFSGFLLGGGGSGTGTVTSVAFADASTTPIYTITGSPVTTAGTLTQTLSTQTANHIFAGPSTGSPAQPTFRSLVAADIPTPLTTAGDLLYENNTPAPDRLPIGVEGQVLAVSSGLPAWKSLSGTAAFASYASSQVSTISSAISATTYTTFSNSPAFTITPNITGTYKIFTNATVENTSSTEVSSYRIFNTSGGATLLQESAGVAYNAASAELDSIYIQSTYTLAAGVTYVFDIQGKTTSGATTILNRGDLVPFYLFAEGVSITSAKMLTHLSASTSFPANTPVIFDAVNFDSASAYSTVTGLFTAPSKGFYLAGFGGAASSANTVIYVSVNGGSTIGIDFFAIAQVIGSALVGGSVMVSVNAGDTIAIEHDTGTAVLSDAYFYVTQQ